MHRTTPRTLTLLVVAALSMLLGGCGDDSSAGSGGTDGAGDTGQVDLQGTYTADSIDSDAHTLVEGTTIRVTFGDSSSGDNVRVHAGCNTMSGAASVSDGTLVVEHLGSTEMGCPPELMAQDEWLGEFLTGSPRIEQDDGAFTLTSDETTIRFATEPQTPDASLQGTAWKLEAILSGSGANGTASSVPTDARDPMLRFTNGVAGWDVRFSTGCNTGGGPVEIGGEVMDFGALVTTKMACAGAVGDLEKTFLGVLGNGTTYVIDGDRLTLTAADGDSGLVFRAG